MKILLVEDEMLVRELAFEDLVDAGHDVTVAGSGDEALGILRRDQGFEVLFTDIRMPGELDGWQLAERARDLIPGLKIIFATGLNDSQYSITVTRGLMQVMNKDELEAVLGHELTHVLNRDVRTMVIASVFAGIITLMAQIIYRAIMWGGIGARRRDDDRRGGGGIWIVVALVVAAIGYVLAIVIQMTLSRSREFVADAGSVELTKNPDAMISALQKISGNAHLDAPESVRSMFHR